MTFVTADVGINANGSLELAKKLIDAAKWSGCDAVKFQKRTIEVVYKGQLDTPRESPWGKTLGEQKYGLEFEREDYDKIDRYCAQIGIKWYASAFDLLSLDFLKRYDLPYNKIASAMTVNDEFVQAVGKERKPTFMSTAMCMRDDILHARDIFEAEQGDSSDLTLMHCVGTYPTDEKDINLKAMLSLKSFGCPVGYSGHEASHSPTVMAVVLGAVAVERHITLDKSMYGSDQAASLEPVQFWHLVNEIRKVPIVLGDGIKRVTEGEKAVARKLRYWL